MLVCNEYFKCFIMNKGFYFHKKDSGKLHMNCTNRRFVDIFNYKTLSKRDWDEFCIIAFNIDRFFDNIH
jgi:hypothetical protein